MVEISSMVGFARARPKRVPSRDTSASLMYLPLLHPIGLACRRIDLLTRRDRQGAMRRNPRLIRSAPPPCSTCQAKMVPIVYGYPGHDLMEAAERGEVVLVGCVVMPHQPRWKCLSCKETPGG
jgi:hypothetical protein